MSDYNECPVHDLMYDSNSSCPGCDADHDKPFKNRIAALESVVNDMLEAIVPYRVNTDGTTSPTIPDVIIERINVLMPPTHPADRPKGQTEDEMTRKTEALGSELNDGLGACPFCGCTSISPGEVIGERDDGSRYCQTGCNNCGALGPESEPTDEAADACWNHRA